VKSLVIAANRPDYDSHKVFGFVQESRIEAGNCSLTPGTSPDLCQAGTTREESNRESQLANNTR